MSTIANPASPIANPIIANPIATTMAHTTTGPSATVTSIAPHVYPMGRVLIHVPCAITPVTDWAWQAPCGMTITNNSFHAVIVAAQLVAVNPHVGATVQPGPVTWRLAPNQSINIPDPPIGWQWVVADMSVSQARTAGWLMIGGLAVGTGFAGYGMYAAVANLIGWAKRQHAHERGAHK